MELRNDGLSYRDILPVGDAITAVRLLAAAKTPEHLIYNLAAGRALPLKDIAEGIASTLHDVKIVYGNGRDAFRHPFSVDTQRLRTLKWAPTHDFREEAPATVAAFR
jgi:nucleoside-diphosphate-sugar epimerase